jgi:hypothetical protein
VRVRSALLARARGAGRQVARHEGQEGGMQGTASILVDRPDTQAYLTVSDLHELVEWSAWPQLGGGGARLVGDGTSVGSELVLLDAAGADRGRLRLVGASLQRVAFELHVPTRLAGEVEAGVAYRLQDVGGSATIVMLDIGTPSVPGPRGLAVRALRRRLLALAGRDLAQLKAHLESGP